MHTIPRHLVALALAIRNGHLRPAEAGEAARSGTAATTLEGLLGVRWTEMTEGERAALRTELENVLADPARARLLVLQSPLPDDVTAPHAASGSQDAARGDLAPTLRGEIRAGSGLPEVLPDPGKRYQVRAEHARGGMGRILLAVDTLVGREVAIKELLAEPAPATPGSVATVQGSSAFGEQERFLREARITGQLEHPNIVPVYEIGRSTEGRTYYTMKFVRGRTMADRIREIGKNERWTRERKLGERLKLLDAFVDVCQALAYAHARGVVNRDLKPANVMLGDFGETVVLDWGLARVRGQEDRVGPRLAAATQRLTAAGFQSGDSTKLTLDGSVIGTPAYMPPEQARGDLDAVDEQSDVWSLGAMLFEILTGVAPFEGPSVDSVIRAVLTLPPPDIFSIVPGAPPELAAVAMAALQKEKARRAGSAAFLADEIAAYRGGRRMRLYRHTLAQQAVRFARRNRALAWSMALTAVVLVAGTAVSLYWAGRAGEESRLARAAEEIAEGARRDAVDKAEAALHAEGRALEERRRADDEAAAAKQAARIAEGQRLAAIARPLIVKHPAQALLLALEGARRAPGPAATNALYEALLPLQEQRKILAHDFATTGARFSPDGRLVASTGMDGTVKIWDAEALSPVRTLEGFIGVVVRPEWSPDSRHLAACSEGGEVRVFDIATGRTAVVTRWPGALLTRIEWFDDGARLAIAAPGQPFRILSLEGTWMAVDRARTAGHAVPSPGGARVASLDAGGTVSVYELPSRRRTAFEGPQGNPFHAIAWAPDGTTLAAGRGDGSIAFYDAAAGTLLRTQAVPGPGPVSALHFHPDGTRLLAYGSGHARVVPLDGSPPGPATPCGGDLHPTALSPDWTRVLATHNSFEGTLADLRTGEVTGTLRSHEYFLTAVDWHPAGRRFLTASRDRRIVLWSHEPGFAIPRYALPEGMRPYGLSPRLDAGFARRSGGEPIELIDGATGRTLYQVEGSDGSTRIHLSALGTAFWTWHPASEELRRHDVDSGRITKRAAGVKAHGRVTVSPQGRTAAIWTSGGQVEIWDLEEMVRVRNCLPPGGLDAAVPDDGDFLAIATGGEGLLRLFDTVKNLKHADAKGHTGYVMRAACSWDGRRVLTSAIDSSVRIWDAATAKSTAVFRWSRMSEVLLWPNPRRDLFLGCSGGEVKVGSIRDGTELGCLPEAFTASWVQWGADGEKFAAVREDGSWRVFPVDPVPAAERAASRDFDPTEIRQFGLLPEDQIEAWNDKWNAGKPVAWNWMVLGQRALDAGDVEKAERCFRRAIEILPSHAEGHDGLAQALCALAVQQAAGSGERRDTLTEALESLRRAVERGSYVPEVLEQAESLRPLRGEEGFRALLEDLREAGPERRRRAGDAREVE